VTLIEIHPASEDSTARYLRYREWAVIATIDLHCCATARRRQAAAYRPDDLVLEGLFELPHAPPTPVLSRSSFAPHSPCCGDVLRWRKLTNFFVDSFPEAIRLNDFRLPDQVTGVTS
jgi:hypothetical protein